MDRLWTPWRYNYITATKPTARPGVPAELDAWPGPDSGCVFCNLIAAADWGAPVLGADAADRAALLVARFPATYVCLNRFPYASGHLLVVPRRHTDSLAGLPANEAEELIRVAQQVETALRTIYNPHGLNLGINLGEAAGAGVAAHLHLHALPRWQGDTNFMTVVGETRILPETLETTWDRVRSALAM